MTAEQQASELPAEVIDAGINILRNDSGLSDAILVQMIYEAMHRLRHES